MLRMITTIVIISAPIRKVVCSMSVHTTVLMPPRNVYSKMMAIITMAVAQIGMFQPSKTKICNTKITRYIRNAEPSNRDRKKNSAPVLCASLPMRLPRYS